MHNTPIHILSELCNSETVRTIKRIKTNPLVELTAALFFKDIHHELFMAKSDFISLYKSWSPEDLQYVECLMQFMQKNFFIYGGFDLHRDFDDHYYSDYWLESSGKQYPFRIYLTRDFLRFISFYQIHYLIPQFTIADLYKEALHPTNYSQGY